MKESILVTGGSGFIGTNLIDFLLSKEHKINNFDNKKPNKENHNKYWTNIDITNKEELINKVVEKSPTHIVHLAAKTGMNIKRLDELAANIEGVSNLIEAASKCSSIKRVVFVSSLLVCRNGYVPKNNEDYCPPNYYGESKMIGEQIVKTSDVDFEWSIVRPTSIWGPWFEHSYRQFFQMISRGLYFHIGNSDVIKPKSYVGNTVYMMYKILFYPNSIVNGQTYYLSDWPETTTREWAEEIKRQLSAKKIRTIPLPIIRIIAKMGDLFKYAGGEPPLTTFRLNNMLTGGLYPVENTKYIVGELPYDLFHSVQETITWMKNQKII